jgi:uncharacterized small protein (DUF1192 family)
MIEEENTPAKIAAFVLGQPLDLLSVEEIDDTIILLQSEIQRLAAARAAKASHLDAANALFSKR